MNQYAYLALGDSYTIGEQVPINESFPYQTVQLLRSYFLTPPAVENPGGGFEEAAIKIAAGADNRRQSLENPLFLPPEIVAVTGFTTNELSRLIDNSILLPQYDFVSLLIGVNNQYRGRTPENFAVEFENLLQRSVAFAGNRADRVFVLSIPDWGVTPFAADRDQAAITAAIDAFNAVCRLLSEKYAAQFIDITLSQREDGNKTGFLATDQLHPSGKEYAKWAALLSNKILSTL